MDLIFYLTRSAPATCGFPGEYPGIFLFLFVICEQPSWYGSVKHILLNMPSLTNFLTDKTSTFKYKCNKIVKQHYLELWTKQAHSLKEGKLRTYLKRTSSVTFHNVV
jgi:hypothetical protein